MTTIETNDKKPTPEEAITTCDDIWPAHHARWLWNRDGEYDLLRHWDAATAPAAPRRGKRFGIFRLLTAGRHCKFLMQ